MKVSNVSCLMSIVLLSAATASALPQKINLREREKLIAELTAKENDEKAKPLQRAWAGFDRRQLEMFLCEDKDLAAKEKAFEDFIANPGLGEDDRVRFLFDLAGKDDFKFRRVELYKTAEKLAMASTNASVHAIFYELSNRVMTPSHWSWCTDLLPEFSADARLRLVEQAQADPVVKGHVERGWLPVKRWRVEALQQLGRFDEVEKILRESVEQATEKNAKSGAAAALAKFYEDRATRWYDEPNADLLKKALGIWELAAALGNGQASASAARLALKLGDMKAAHSWIDKAVAAQKDQKPTVDQILILGDIAYAERNWKEAATWYAQYPENRSDWRLLHKIAGAFHAAGDNAKAVEFLKAARKKCGNRYEQPHLEAEIAALSKKL